MKRIKSHRQYIRHPSMLCQTIKTEEWLHKMAQNGRILVSVHGSQYNFKQTSPHEYYYFVMTPEAGTNSDVWVFHEFEQEMGKRIPCSGYSFFSPSHILLVTNKNSGSQSDLISYYIRYRNYRLLKRFRKNAIVAALFFLLGTMTSVVRFPNYAVALFPYILVSGLLLFHFIISFYLFHKDCLQQGCTKPAQKPKRPGY